MKPADDVAAELVGVYYWNEQHRKDVSAAITQARREGAEDMRALAAGICQTHAERWEESVVKATSYHCERLIRILPLPGDE